MFSHSKTRSPGAPQRGANSGRPAHTAGFRAPARGIRPLAVILGCAAAVAIAGCKPGTFTSASSTATPTAGASAGSVAQAGSSTTSAITALAANAPGVKSFVATLEIHATGRLATDLSGILTEQTQPSPLIEVTTTVPSGLEAILSGGTAFLKIGALTQTAGKPWVAAPISGLANGTGASLAPMIQQLQASNPLAQTQMFPAATDLRRAGASTINGTRTTEYTGSYSLAAGLARLPQSERAAVQSDLQSSGITLTRFSVWVDSANQVRKISLVEIGKSTQVDIVLVIVSLNQPVQIQIPLASEVAGATGITAPKPTVTSSPAPVMTPTPAVTSSPAAVASPQPTAVQTTQQPSHW